MGEGGGEPRFGDFRDGWALEKRSYLCTFSSNSSEVSKHACRRVV